MNSKRSNGPAAFRGTLWLILLLMNFWGSLKAQTAEEQLVSANTGFGFRLLKQLAAERPGANTFISPYSISTVLEMVSTGARGQTLEELRQVLGLDVLRPDGLGPAYDAVNQSIGTARTNLALNIANAIWYRSDAPLDADFAAVNEKYYHAELAGLDFSAPASIQKINQWAAQNTEGKIQTILQPPIPGDTAIVLANAIYFKGTWLDQFDPKLTRERGFHLADGTERQVQMMAQTRTFSYQEGAGFQAVQLFYAGKRLEMEIFLPNANSTLAALLEQLNSGSWQNHWLPGFGQHKGTLVLPRLNIRYNADLKRPLSAMGLRSALSPAADFSGMSSSRLYLSQIKHQSFVEVNEQGTEAAAVTTGVMALASMRNAPPPFQMVVDRPFLFLISDQQTKSVLFLGLVFDP